MKDENLTYKIIGPAMRVHATLGAGFQEVIYQRALEAEMINSGISFVREFEMPVYYQGQQVGQRRVDFLVDDRISVEIKSVSLLDNLHLAQAINYLESYNLEIGLLVNFGGRSLEFKRLANNKFNNEIDSGVETSG